jgi:hypothetical protein
MAVLFTVEACFSKILAGFHVIRRHRGEWLRLSFFMYSFIHLRFRFHYCRKRPCSRFVISNRDRWFENHIVPSYFSAIFYFVFYKGILMYPNLHMILLVIRANLTSPVSKMRLLPSPLGFGVHVKYDSA